MGDFTFTGMSSTTASDHSVTKVHDWEEQFKQCIGCDLFFYYVVDFDDKTRYKHEVYSYNS